MRAVLLLLLIVAIFSLSAAQMTFTDHWTKKNVPVTPSKRDNTFSSPWCRDEDFYMRSLEWLQRQTEIVQRQMEACRQANEKNV